MIKAPTLFMQGGIGQRCQYVLHELPLAHALLLCPPVCRPGPISGVPAPKQTFSENVARKLNEAHSPYVGVGVAEVVSLTNNETARESGHIVQ